MKTINLKNAIKLRRDINRTVEHLTQLHRLINDGGVFIERYCKQRDDETAHLAELRNGYGADPSYIALNSAIDAVEKRCSARLIDTDDVVFHLIRLDDSLSISKKAMDGIAVIIDLNYGVMPNAYKGIPESTQVHAEYKSGSWRIADVGRAPLRRHKFTVIHTEQSKQALIDRFTVFD